MARPAKEIKIVENNEDIDLTTFEEPKSNLKRARELSNPGILFKEGHPDDLVSVRVIKDHKHVIGKNTYTYKAMVPTDVPRQVAQILDECGLLYIGGTASKRILEIENKPNPSEWKIKVPRDGNY